MADEKISGAESPPSSNSLLYPGKSPDSMTVDEAREAWHEMTLDKENKYGRWPRDVFVTRRNQLFEKAFGQAIKEQEKSRQERGQRMAEEAKEKLADYQVEQVQQKTLKELEARWGRGFQKELELTQRFVAKNTSEKFRQFLDESRLGDDARVIFFTHSLAKLAEAYPGSEKFLVPQLEKAVREFAESRAKKEKPKRTTLGGYYENR